MATIEDHRSAIRQRLELDSCNIDQLDWGGKSVLLGRKSLFRWRWLATRLHLFVLVAEAAITTRQAIAEFTEDALDFAQYAKGGLPVGLQTGIAVFPVLLSVKVEADAATWAAEKQRVRFGCIARPVVIDVPRSQVWYYRGNPVFGAVYSGLFRQKARLYFEP